jgi:predicted phage terminase large subunit-like protein
VISHDADDILETQAEFTPFALEQLEGRVYELSPHQKLICDTLDRVINGEITRLIINIPPGYAKTAIAVWSFIARGFAINPACKFLHVSYSDTLVNDNSANVRTIIQSDDYQTLYPYVQLDTSTGAKGLWKTTAGGAMRAAASGGAVTGFRAGVIGSKIFSGALLVDDPLKPDDARSDVTRKFINSRWKTVFRSRLAEKSTPVIVIMQRINIDDFTASLIRDSGEEWHHLILPAYIEPKPIYPTDHGILIEHNLPCGSLWQEKMDDAQALSRMNDGQYSQNPSPDGGGLFKPLMIQIVDAIPHGVMSYVRGWDLASSPTGDYTVGAKIGKLPDGRFIIADIVRFRKGPDERDAIIKTTTQRDGHLTKCSIPQDPGQAGKTQVLYLTRQLAGFNVISSPESGDKITRAEPFAAQVNVGNVLMLRGAWNTDAFDELEKFPNGANDDQVDALSRAFSELFSDDLAVWSKLGA